MGGDLIANLFPGDRLIENRTVPSPTVLKIDVEGAELDDLRGLDETLAGEDSRLLYIELHGRIAEFGGSWEELREYLRERRFSIETITRRGGEEGGQPFIKAIKK